MESFLISMMAKAIKQIVLDAIQKTLEESQS